MYTKNFCENQAELDEALDFWRNEARIKDAQFFHDAPHDYKLIGTWLSRDAAFDVFCQYAPATGALQMISHENDKLSAQVEFKPLGGDEYAVQYRYKQGYQKALITYRDGKILAFDFVHYMSGGHYKSIYPDGQGLQILISC